ncbi:MAG TPA: patatin-like phospholipase family protein, partial [bacterium]|nr:patatin-like phospholipase family protein [bacterium]
SLKIPFVCLATDLTEGKRIVIERGSLRKAIQASMAIPGVFPPVIWEDRVLCDGASVSYTPVQALREKGCDFVLAVEVQRQRRRVARFLRGIDVIVRAQDTGMWQLHEEELKKSDFVLHPQVKNVHWAHFRKASFCIRKGEEETERNLKSLKRALRIRRIRYLLGNII